MPIVAAFVLLFLSFSAAATPKIFFLFGPSQSGKSTWINTVGNLKGDARAAVGNPSDRASTTSAPKLYDITNKVLFSGEKFIVIDVPGLWDNRLALSNDDIKLAIKEAVLKNTGGDFSLAGIIAFESLAGNLISFLAYIPILEEIFGANFLASTLLLLTKGDKLANEEYQKSVLDEASKKGLEAMRWDTLVVNASKKVEFLKDEQMLDQLKIFERKVSKLAPYQGAGLQEMQKNIEKRALEIYATQEKKNVTSYVTVEEEKKISVPLIAEQERQNAAQFVDVEREIQTGTRMEEHWIDHEKWDGPLGRVFGSKKSYKKKVLVEVPVMEKYIDRQLVDTMGTSNKPIFRVEKVQCQKAIQSQVAPWSMDYCRELARQELLDTIHAKHY